MNERLESMLRAHVALLTDTVACIGNTCGLQRRVPYCISIFLVRFFPFPPTTLNVTSMGPTTFLQRPSNIELNYLDQGRP